MKSKFLYLFWAIVIFLVGIALLPGIFDLRTLSTTNWILIEISAALALFVTYFLDGTKKWGWLLPAFILTGMAIDLSKEFTTFIHLEPNGVPIIIGIALWFFVGYMVNRKHWWLLIPAYGLIIASVETSINTLIVPSALYGENGSTLLLAFSSGAGIMFMLALPFFVISFVSKKSWWALIPAGSLTSFGLAQLLQFLYSDRQNNSVGIFVGTLLLGLSTTFALLWLRRKTQPTSWAIYPSAALLLAAILAFVFGNGWTTLTDQAKIIFFTILSTACFVGYFIHGLRKWGWLFPALIFAALAFTMWMSINNMEDSPLIGIPIFASFALPFYIGFICEPKHWWLLVPAYFLTMLMIFTLTSESDYEGIIVMSLFALPFFIAYIWSKKNWWAFIPGGFFATIGVVSLIEELVPHKEFASLPNMMHWGVFNWVLFLLMAVTFGVVWLRRNSQPTQWAAYPAAGFLALATLSFILGEKFQEYWLSTVMLVIAGLLVMALFNRKVPAVGPQTPQIKV
jgi:hypothetical protein